MQSCWQQMEREWGKFKLTVGNINNTYSRVHRRHRQNSSMDPEDLRREDYQVDIADIHKILCSTITYHKIDDKKVTKDGWEMMTSS